MSLKRECPVRKGAIQEEGRYTTAFSRARTARLRPVRKSDGPRGETPARSSALRASASQTAATSASVGDGRGEDEGSSAQNGRGSAGSVRDMCGSVDHGCSSYRLRPAIRVRGTSAPWPVRWTVLCPSLLSRQPIIRKFFRKRREKHCAERCAHAQKIALFTCAIAIRERKRTPHIVQRPSLGIPPVQVLQQRTQPAISEKT